MNLRAVHQILIAAAIALAALFALRSLVVFVRGGGAVQLLLCLAAAASALLAAAYLRRFRKKIRS